MTACSILAALLISGLLALSSCRGDGPSPGTNVVLVIIDAQRADHAGCYGYHRSTTPVLDSLASCGTVFLSMQAQSSWTLPSVGSILTGYTPRRHAAGRRGNDVYPLDPTIPTLATRLCSSGYYCIGYFNNYLLSAEFGFHRGFDSYYCNPLGDGMADLSVDSCIAVLERRTDSEPFFLVLHLFDPHDPYDPPHGWDTLFSEWGSMGITDWEQGLASDLGGPEAVRDHLLDMYDAEIAYTDHHLGRLLSWLREAGEAGRTLVIVTADHGEEFLEHGGVYHGKTMFQEVLQVPLVVSGPGVPVGLIENTLVGQIDIVPTVLSAVGLQVPADMLGRDLLSANLESGAILPSSNLNSGIVPVVVSVRRDNDKVITNVETGITIGYDLAVDPREQEPVPPDSGLVEASLEYWATPRLANPDPVDRSVIDATLRDLGYI